MLIRVFRAKPKPGKADDLAALVNDVSIPFVDAFPGLLARHAGRGVGATSDEIIMISVWNDLAAMKAMTGDDWESEVIPDQRLADHIETCSVRHYELIGAPRER